MDALSELLIKTYPQGISLENGATVTLRPLLRMMRLSSLDTLAACRQKTVSASRRT